jgi:hypothetical protein
MAGASTGVASDADPIVYFYYPPGADDRIVPESSGVFVPRPGGYIWTVKTYGYLSQTGFPCRLTAQLPDEGIIVSHREFFPDRLVPNDRQLFVCIVADHWRHSFAQLHLVQNPRDPILMHSSPLWPAAFLPHWPETGVIPRDPARGARVQNVSYFGLPGRLAPQLLSAKFAARLLEHGFSFRIVGRERWNDYSDTDAVLAVRSFARVSFHKYPPSKLYNSWIAGVPALLGQESAYRTERRSAYDYFEVRSVDDILATLVRLRDDPALRAAVSRNCTERAAGITPARIAAAWIDFLTTRALPAYCAWRRRSALSRRAFLAERMASYAAFRGDDFGVRSVGYLRKQLRVAIDRGRGLA